jgi:hypothetical protein
LVTLLACGGGARPDRDGPRQQLDEASDGDAGSPRQDAGGDQDGPLFCTENVAPGLYVTFERPNGACDELAIVATDVGYAETLECRDFEGVRCNCFGAEERRGTYQITASIGAPPVELARAGPITVKTDRCHVITETVVLRLAALPAAAGAVTSSDAGGADAGDAAQL